MHSAKKLSMRKFMKKNLIRLSVLALTFAVASMGSLWAQNSTPSQKDQHSAQPSQSQRSSESQPTSAQNQNAKEFMGTIVKENGALMLKDSSAGTSYKVDDESKVKDYEGKQVKVTGTLDSSSNVIHIESIQGMS